MKQLDTNLIEADWLVEQLDHESVKLVDSTWFMPDSGRNGKLEWAQSRIPGAVFFDYDSEIKDHQSSLPHMLPTPEKFEKAVGALGISHSDLIVVYSRNGLFSAARCWWMFKVMGHQNVAVLNMSFDEWDSKGYPVERGEPVSGITQAVYQSQFAPERVIDKHDLLHALMTKSSAVVDVRPAQRFWGQVPEPREGMASGHMPGASNLPFINLIENGKLIVKEKLLPLIEPYAAENRPLVSSCGSGVTACIFALAMEEFADKTVCVYDGSWSEWGTHPDLPVTKE
ncbi:sulfurtransferase [Veronia pacifica]|uniref:Sulfurtransferase n=1 Tax=Veronia pacifica TaxID=1080227 RepID=A0A1C3EMS7_9GAMM|nr:sulfurtransferase [Veronia pacifica]ODA34553.1 thiosulfate sulfurtransferase [Veronia pacifica]